MDWNSHTLAFAVSDDQLERGADPRKLLHGSMPHFDHFVHASSRNGRLLWRLDRICQVASNGKNLYLFEDACLLRHEAMKHAATQLEALITEIELNPALVVEAMKYPHEPATTVQMEGFEPLPVQLVYPSDAIIKDGWVYSYTEEQARRYLDQSCASNSPCPDGDDDGESLPYVFNFLKSHLALLRFAAQSGMVVVYGDPSR